MCLSQRRDFILNNNNTIQIISSFFKEYKKYSLYIIAYSRYITYNINNNTLIWFELSVIYLNLQNVSVI